MMKLLFAITVLEVCMLSGCATRTVKYVDVPEWQLREGMVPERYVDADGVLVINRPRRLGNARIESATAAADGSRVELDDGSVKLHALLPGQVVANTVQCIFDEEYDLLWDQVLSERTKQEYERSGQGREGFIAFIEANRNELFPALNRIAIGMQSPEVLHELGPHGGTRLRLHPHFAKDFDFIAVDTVYEDFGMKLLMIHPRIQSNGQ
ncbi:MAG: hypothetical protein ACR2GY_04335 [Phycisphaerales bacterium]